MGFSLAKLWNIFSEAKQLKVLMVGLDNAGKTTILFKVKLGEVLVHSTPTLGFNLETLEYKNTTFTVWDMGGQDRTRKLWRHYYEGVQAIIYVIDSNDRDRLKEAKEELHRMLSEKQLEKAILCVMANKQDLPGVLSTNQVVEGLELSSLPPERVWYIQGTCATTGEGILEAFSWLVSKAKEFS